MATKKRHILYNQLTLNYGINPNSKLCQPTTSIACDFCPLKFENQLQYLVHNAKHIIIPAEKLDPRITSQHQSAQINLNKCESNQLIAKKNVLSTFTAECKVNLEMLPLQLNNYVRNVKNDNDEVLQSFLQDCEVNLGVKSLDNIMLLKTQVPTDSIYTYDSIETESKSYLGDVNDCDIDEVEYKIDNEDIPLTTQNDGNIEKINKSMVKGKRKFKDKNKNGTKIIKKKGRHSIPLNTDVVIASSKSNSEPVHYDELIDSTQKHGCMFCLKKFDNRYNQLQHYVDTHLKVNINFKKDVLSTSPFFCDACQTFFTKFNNWQSHVNLTHKDKIEKILKCKSCRQIYAFGKKRHKRLFHSDTLTHCRICDKYNCKKHILAKAKKKNMFTCEILVDGVPLVTHNKREVKKNDNTLLRALLNDNNYIIDNEPDINIESAVITFQETFVDKEHVSKDINTVEEERDLTAELNSYKDNREAFVAAKSRSCTLMGLNINNFDGRNGKEKKKRGRPKKQKKVGRPRKNPIDGYKIESLIYSPPSMNKKKVGRPKKNTEMIHGGDTLEKKSHNDVYDSLLQPKLKKNGRPRKKPGPKPKLESNGTNKHGDAETNVMEDIMTEELQVNKTTFLAEKARLEKLVSKTLFLLCDVCYLGLIKDPQFEIRSFYMRKTTFIVCDECKYRYAFNLVSKEFSHNVLPVSFEPPVNMEPQINLAPPINSIPTVNITVPVTFEPIELTPDNTNSSVPRPSASSAKVKKNSDECILGM